MGNETRFNLYIGDLHLGNVYSDIKAFIELIKKAKTWLAKRQAGVKEVIIVGDVIDGIDKYETQPYKQLPETLSVQRACIKWLIEYLNSELNPERIVFVLGNHEKDFKGLLFDEELLMLAYPNVLVVDKYVDSLGFLVVHQLSKSSRFGSESGWTPSMVSKSKEMILATLRSGAKKVRGMVCAHVHKVLDILRVGEDLLILLPAFLHPGRTCAEEELYQPSILLMSEDEIAVLSSRFGPLDEIVSSTTAFLSQVSSSRKRAVEQLLVEKQRSNNTPEKEECVNVVYASRTYRICREEVERFLETLKRVGNVVDTAKILKVSKNRAYAILRAAKQMSLLTEQ